MKKIVMALMASGSCLISVTPVHAQQAAAASTAADDGYQIEDIVVTAQKRAQNLQDIPLAISAFSGEDLADRGIKEIADLTKITPGLQIGNQNGIATPFLRGIGNASVAVGNEPSVATYIDGVYYATVASGFFSMGNVDRVEVLKGPQGTLFGRNSSGGVIHIITKDPGKDPGFEGNFSYGNYDIKEGSVYGHTGLGDNLAVGVSLNGRRQGNGYGRSITNGHRHSYNDYFTARAKLVYEPSDLTKVTLSGTYGWSKASVQANIYPGTTRSYVFNTPVGTPVGTNPRTVQVAPAGFYDSRNNRDSYTQYSLWGTSLRIDQELPFATLSSITAYSTTNSYASIDVDFTEFDDFYVLQPAKIKQFTQEFQLTSLKGSSVDWVVGAFYYDVKQTYESVKFRGPAVGGGFDGYFQQKPKSYAAYGQASYEFLPKLTFTGGLRFSHDKVSADGFLTLPGNAAVVIAPRNPQSKSGDKLTFKAALDYKVTDDVLAYGSFSRGYKSQSFNLLVYSGIANKPEVIDAYEIGIKSDLFDRRVRLNLSGFYYDITDPQIQLLRVGSIVLSNADSARVYGLDVDFTAVLTEGLTLRASGTFLDSKYSKYGENCGTAQAVNCAPSGPPLFGPQFGAQSPLLGIDAAGNYTTRAPKFSGNIGIDYVIPVGDGKLTLSGDYYYNDGYYFEPDNIIRQPKYGLLNGQIKYAPTENVSVAVWGKNLNDKKYAVYSGTQAGAAGSPYIAGAPRTYGVSVGFNF
ncbi:TonB-dependent receptor [Sphingobium subterraneum]|uniref:Iron complex outermembrane receptor protein n=1 Tax=Sphingobium subterraneum TaxID=627688 RepID=A0A841J9R6_9SPHN|nr:TonB-dependent receptor [Sphingobium subterraneum]MBB6125298.1 iron complex outermembrane receptor protein [Sphingobium subterraneum]